MTLNLSLSFLSHHHSYYIPLAQLDPSTKHQQPAPSLSVIGRGMSQCLPWRNSKRHQQIEGRTADKELQRQRAKGATEYTNRATLVQ